MTYTNHYDSPLGGWIVNSKLNNFFKVILPVLNWCQVTERGMKSVIVKPIHIISKPQF